jgi:hypothetical protein
MKMTLDADVSSGSVTLRPCDRSVAAPIEEEGSTLSGERPATVRARGTPMGLLAMASLMVTTSSVEG